MPEVQKERPVLVGFDELDRLVRQAVGDVFPVGSVGDRADVMPAAGVAVFEDPIRRKITGRAGAGLGVKGDVEAVLVRPMLAAQPQMPFPKMPGAVARFVQDLGESRQAWIEIVLALGIQEPLVGRGLFGIRRRIRGRGGAMAARGGHPMAGGILTAQNRRPRRRAERQRVGIGEPHRLFGQPLHARRLVILRAVGRAVHPAHVIDEKQNNIRPILRNAQRRERGKDQEQQPARDAFHKRHPEKQSENRDDCIIAERQSQSTNQQQGRRKH